ncbi:hypothetical protein ACHAW5_003202 [Stephanodiscus triporus]|uniref:Uncharacterized protein n=1 Tax=Stephanodiscus triporus TaxID=2934178 RepID=A0ABD3MET9_9STRA
MSKSSNDISAVQNILQWGAIQCSFSSVFHICNANGGAITKKSQAAEDIFTRAVIWPLCAMEILGGVVAYKNGASNLVSPPSHVAVLDWSHPRVGAVRLVALAQSGIRSMSGAALNDEQFRDGKPTLEYARTLPKTFATMTNKQVLHFAELSVPEACRECVVRDIMSVDQVEYDEAMKVFEEICTKNREGMVIAALPFYAGFGSAVIGCYASIPLVFDRTLVEWFNERICHGGYATGTGFETFLRAEVGWSPCLARYPSASFRKSPAFRI